MQKLWSVEMRITSSYIQLRDVRIHAYHGVMPQERKVGADFIVNLRVGYPIERAMDTDSVDDTLSYADLLDIVKREMEQPSNLVEHVAGRIVRTIERTFPRAESIDLEILKENPPMGADSHGAGIELHAVRARHGALR